MGVGAEQYSIPVVDVAADPVPPVDARDARHDVSLCPPIKSDEGRPTDQRPVAAYARGWHWPDAEGAARRRHTEALVYLQAYRTARVRRASSRHRLQPRPA